MNATPEMLEQIKNLKTLNQYPAVADSETGYLLLILIANEDAKLEEMWKQDLKKERALRMIDAILSRTPVKVDYRSRYLIAALTNGVPGNVVLYVHTMHKLAEDGAFVFPLWAARFGLGFPGPDAMATAWDAQKYRGLNLLDLPEAWA